MKKSIKRILCSVLSLATCSTLVVENALRLHAQGASTSTSVTAETSFKDVTGLFDTSKIREENFNSSVLKAEDVAPVYETRTVMVTLSGEPMVERSKGEAVASYMESWSGEMARTELSKEQSAFLQALTRKGISYSHKRSYSTLLNAVALELDTSYVSEIKGMKGVESVVITTAYEAPQTEETVGTKGPATNETEVYGTGIYDSSAYLAEYGKGAVVAVLDTGLDYTHSAFQTFQTPMSEWTDEEKALLWTEDRIQSKIDSGLLFAEKRSGTLEVADVYRNAKVPFAYDYADDDADVYPSYSNHGTHVAGIIGGYDPTGYTDKDGNYVYVTNEQGDSVKDTFYGVVPDAQLVICKVFTDDLDDKDLGGAVTEDIVAALEDCVTLGVDVINMSLGTSCGFTTTNDGDDEGKLLNEVYEKIGEQGISLICAASNDYSAGYGGVYGTNLAENPDAGTVGSPSTYASALSVASINGQPADYAIANKGTGNQSYVFFEEARDIDGNALDFVKQLNELYPENNGKFEYVVIPGVGHSADYTAKISKLLKEKKRLVLVKRGDTTFKDKVKLAKDMGAAGIIVYNNVAGVIRMNLGEIVEPIPAISINMQAGEKMAKVGRGEIGTFEINEAYAAGPFMSEFSSWGPTPDLKLKPEITAHGGEITSAVPGGYGEQSGTSMATPNMAGFFAVVRSYLKTQHADLIKDSKGDIDLVKLNRLAMQLTMSTAGMVLDQEGLPYSPRKQGAGVAKLDNVISNTTAYLWTENQENDNRPKLEIGDDKDNPDGIYTLNFKVTNFGAQALTFKPDCQFMTETLSSDNLTVSEQAYMLDSSKAVWKVGGVPLTGDTITVNADETLDIQVVLPLSDSDKEYIEKSFENGMYVEGFLRLLAPKDGKQCDLIIPFLGFYGDWDKAPMLDYSAYEVAENAQDASVLEEDKIKASVWATQPYNIYYNDKYVLPMGGYLYLLPEDADPVYVDEEHNAVSRYNDYYGEGNAKNYMTSTGIKAVYAGLLRNARVVKYKLIDEATGEVIHTDEIKRVAKAYSGGGSAVPANVKLEMYPEEEGFIANGKYRMEFEFFKDIPEEGEVAREDDTFSFSFTVDYEAPVMQDARIRYYNYKEGNKEKQQIYLDVDVFDNHYVQTLLVCYPKQNKDGELSLQLATEYPTPVRNSVKNGVTTVSVDITDMYEKYGNMLYVQLDDYALNTCLYQVDLGKANLNMLPDSFSLVEDDDLKVDKKGNGTLTLAQYEAHKVSLAFPTDYEGDGDESNFSWTTNAPNGVAVKNGEIVGLKKGTWTVSVSSFKNNKLVKRDITVTVTDEVSDEMRPFPYLSFDVIQTDGESLQKASSGTVPVNAGADIQLTVLKDPWYHPMTDLKVVWSSSKEEIASVTQEGLVHTKKKGSVSIYATIYQKDGDDWKRTSYQALASLNVQDEFTVSNYTLTKYKGEGGVVVIPTDRNIMYIGSEAFKENNNITKIVIPESVMEIHERAFIDCTALKEVYFVSMTEKEKDAPAKSKLTMINKNAFEGCINLEKVDFSHVKTATIASDCFKGCAKLSTVIDMPSIGTMHHRAFAGTALTSADLTGLHMSGRNVFSGCTKLTEIKTSKFTAIGESMFAAYQEYVNGVYKEVYPACTALQSVTLYTPKIGNKSFAGCTNLKQVTLDSKGEDIKFDIGAHAFDGCGKTGTFTFDVKAGGKVRSIGANAFANSTLASFDFAKINGLEVLGENVFANTGVREIVLSANVDLELLRITGVPFKNVKVTVAPGVYYEENGVIYTDDKKEKILYVNADATVGDEFALPASVVEIAPYAFSNSAISKVIFNDNLEVLGEGVFKNSKLTSVQFAANSKVTEIPVSAFEGSLLASIDLPENVTAIGGYAFAGSALASFTGGEGLLSIGSHAFESCNALASISLQACTGEVTMGDEVFANCATLVSVALPSVKALGDYTFFNSLQLSQASFGDNSRASGKYTFYNTKIAHLDLSNIVTEFEPDINGEEVGFVIDEGFIADNRSLKKVILPASTRRIERAAFSGCTALATVEGATKNGLGQITRFGNQAFYNTAFTKLDLDEAVEIGYMAFAAFEDLGATVNTTAKYTEISMPNAVTIAPYAFYNGGVSTVEIPASVQEIGVAAFASSDKLTAFTVDQNNAKFFAEEGVLYRYTNSAKDEFELVSYPTARMGEGEEEARTYEIKEGTTRIMGYAFYNLNADALDKVLLPYSVNAVGDSAFFISGVMEYVFESIQAPVLETSHRPEVREVTKDNQVEYKGYYYTNFQTYLYHFTKYGKQTSEMKMTYPRNGKGYNNPIYTMYFGVRTATAVDGQEDGTRACIQELAKMPEASEIATWAAWEQTEENIAKVKAFDERMKTVRGYYDNIMKSEGQKAYFTAEMQTKFLAVEKAFRGVKEAFGLQAKLLRLQVDTKNSTHKTEYLVGESFDSTGLVILAIYDDGTRIAVPVEELTIEPNRPLTAEDSQITVRYDGKSRTVTISVTDPTPLPPVEGDSSSSDSASSSSESASSEEESGKKKGCGSVVAGLPCGLLVLGAALGVVRRRRKENGEK